MAIAAMMVATSAGCSTARSALGALGGKPPRVTVVNNIEVAPAPAPAPPPPAPAPALETRGREGRFASLRAVVAGAATGALVGGAVGYVVDGRRGAATGAVAGAGAGAAAGAIAAD